MQLKHWGRRAAYTSGALATYHRWRHRKLLTAVAFHRVLPAGDERTKLADPAWTVTDEVFGQCLRFFRNHYTVVRAADVVECIEQGRALPARALLITIDDGWSDTEEYALPLLRAWKMPAAVFVFSEAVDDIEPWQELLRRALRTGQLTAEHWRWLWSRLWSGVDGQHPRPASPAFVDPVALEAELSKVPALRRMTILREFRARLSEPNQDLMISGDQLRVLDRQGLEIGSHGLTHTSITLAPDPWVELRESRNMLANLLGHESGPRIFSFPNGRYNGKLVELAHAAGYSCVFTSEPHLNAFPEHRAPSCGDGTAAAVLGRISIPQRAVTDHAGKFCGERLASWLFLRRAVTVPIVHSRAGNQMVYENA